MTVCCAAPAAIFAEEGDDLSGVAQMVAEAASSAPASVPQPPSKPEPTAYWSSPPPASEPKETKPKLPKGNQIFASPVAKKIAFEKGIPLANIKGTGPEGRIIRDDVELYQPPAPSASTVSADAAPTSLDCIDIPVSNICKVKVGMHLTPSKQELPHYYYLTIEINMNKVFKLRKVFNKTLGAKDQAAKLSVDDFVLKAVACALKDAATGACLST